MKAFTYSLIHVLNFCAISGLFCEFPVKYQSYQKSYTGVEIFHIAIFFVSKKFFV